MAVIIQPMLAPRAAGVAYSQHPVTGLANQAVINAVFGLAEPLMSGTTRPDQYVVEVGSDPPLARLLERDLPEKAAARVATGSGLTERPLPDDDRNRAVLEDREILALARLAREVERVAGKPADIEWALDDEGFWLLQARPIPMTHAAARGTIVWSRANFKETLPEVPSHLGLSFLQEFMDRHIVRHYLELGCRIPPGWSSVRIMQGRPYINVTLFQWLIAQLGGDPSSITEQMGGEGRLHLALPPRLPLLTIVRASISMERRIRRAARRGPAWFTEMKEFSRMSLDGAQALAPSDLLSRLDRLGERLGEGEMTFATVAGVSQGLYVLGLLLQRWGGPDWRPLLNASLQGVGNVISATQILLVGDLAERARRDPDVRAFFLTEPFVPEQFRHRLAGTSWLTELESFLGEYGHRAVGESDVMAPRFSEQPEYFLRIIRAHLQSEPGRSSADALRSQEQSRETALQEIRRRFSWRLPLWIAFRWWYRRLCRYLVLREANRHHLMYFTASTRRLLLLAGERLAADGILAGRDDIFFLTEDEVRALVRGEGRDWKELVATRRAEWARHLEQSAPDLVVGQTGSPSLQAAEPSSVLRGIAISAGYAEGPVCVIQSPSDASKVKKGDILVAPVIDPAMAPLLGLAAGLVVEMGGTLSHGAIIAREYGLPAIANVRGVTRLLQDGERVTVDASLGEIIRLNP
jgi:pyruvate,water dikinase